MNFIIYKFSVYNKRNRCYHDKWFAIHGNNIFTSPCLAKDGSYIMDIDDPACQFASRREAIGFVKGKFKSVKIMEL